MRNRKAPTLKAERAAYNIEQCLWHIAHDKEFSYFGTFEGEIPEVMLRELVNIPPQMIHYRIQSVERSWSGAGSREIFMVPVIGKVLARTLPTWKDFLRQQYASEAISWEMHETAAMKRSIIHTLSILIENSPARKDFQYAKDAERFAELNHLFEVHESFLTTNVQCIIDLSLIDLVL